MDVDASSVRMVSSKEAFDIVAAGSPCVITGFAFEHMVKVRRQTLLRLVYTQHCLVSKGF